MAIPDSIHTKSELRAAMRCRLRKPLPDSSTVVADLSEWLSQNTQQRSIATFAALPGEPDLQPLLSMHPDRRWLFPKACGEHLKFYRIHDPAGDLTPGRFGILEPSPSLEQVPIPEIDVFFCPGLAFDTNGGRLGRGGGFYDRMLAAARPDSTKIGVCFTCQMTANTFSEAHDVRMHMVKSAG